MCNLFFRIKLNGCRLILWNVNVPDLWGQREADKIADIEENIDFKENVNTPRDRGGETLHFVNWQVSNQNLIKVSKIESKLRLY